MRLSTRNQLTGKVASIEVGAVMTVVKAVSGDVRPARGLTRLLPVTWDGACARILAGHRAAFLHGAALADALAAISADWTPGAPAPLVLLR